MIGKEFLHLRIYTTKVPYHLNIYFRIAFLDLTYNIYFLFKKQTFNGLKRYINLVYYLFFNNNHLEFSTCTHKFKWLLFKTQNLKISFVQIQIIIKTPHIFLALNTYSLSFFCKNQMLKYTYQTLIIFSFPVFFR